MNDVDALPRLDDLPARYARLGGEAGSEFHWLVEALRDALGAHGVGTREKNEMPRLLVPMKRDVVTQ